MADMRSCENALLFVCLFVLFFVFTAPVRHVFLRSSKILYDFSEL